MQWSRIGGTVVNDRVTPTQYTSPGGWAITHLPADHRPDRPWVVRRHGSEVAACHTLAIAKITAEDITNGETERARYEEQRAARVAELAGRPPLVHVNYPHEPGRLYDCPACEAACHCTPGDVECVYEGTHSGVAAP